MADASGSARIAQLGRIRPVRHGSPGLVVDRRGRRVLVFAARAPVAELDLRTMHVRYHRVEWRRVRRRQPRTSSREALWLGRGLVAVFGQDSARAPAGVQIADTKTWRVRTVDPNAGRARRAAGRLLVYTSDVVGPRAPGVGLRVFTRDGRRLVSHLLGKQALDVEVVGGRAYAYRAGGRSRALHVVSVRAGTIVRTTRPPPRAYDLDVLGRP